MSIVTLALLSPSLDGAGRILIFLAALSVLIVLHEAGHFLIARRNGVRVNDFAVGFGPTLFKWTSPRSGTNYRINVLPLGGYCAMQGEDGKTNEAEQQRIFRTGNPAQSDNFQAKSPLQRLSIVVAGPIANFILAFAILFGIGLGADYMMIPLMAAQLFGPNSLARAMGIILPVGSIGQTCCPFLLGVLRDHQRSYHTGLSLVIATALAGAVAIILLPSPAQPPCLARPAAVSGAHS